MRMLYVTDLHGDTIKYNKLLTIAVDNDIKLIVNGGDMLPKQCNRHMEQPLFVSQYLRNYFTALKKEDITCLAMLGNDDLLSMDKLFNDVCNEFDNVYNIAQNKVTIDGYEFIGMNYILDHPFACKDRVVMEDNYIFQRQFMPYALLSNDFDYDKINDWIEYATTKLPKMYDILSKLPKPQNADKTIYVTHMAPAGLKLGQLRYPDLDIGSVDIYNFFKEKQPLLTLHGHIHESPDTKLGKWINTIDKTTCINTGQTEINNDLLIYADIDLKNQKYTREIVSVSH
ncbi:MAG: metallophosphoesterase [Oscillospiraceae bacterium]|nr:metallophosphoesterase [Oscillospiraceae bacterium]